MTHTEALARIEDALADAECKYPHFYRDPIHAAAVVAEEAGELVQAALNYTYLDGSREAMIAEATHTAAMGLRFLLEMHRYEARQT